MNTYAIKGSGKWCLGSKRLFLLLLGCWLPVLLFAQRDAYWHFGDSVALKWDTSGPVVMAKSNMAAYEPSSSMSDTAGNLLFYTNGNRIWDRSGAPMANGDSLIPNHGADPMFSITQGTLVLPFPGYSSLYLIVFTGGPPLIQSVYAIVDMDLNGGLGDIDPIASTKVLDSFSLSEKTSAVRHANGRDWWIVQYSCYKPFLSLSDSTFKYYLLSPRGLEYSHSQTLGLDVLCRGEMVFSEDGSMLGMVGVGGVQVYGFDRCSGLLTESKMRLDGQWGYGAAFSPNNRFFYFTSDPNKQLFQYDLEPEANTDTLTLVYEAVGGVQLAALELALDGRIYMVGYSITSSVPLNEYLNVIRQPDVYGLGCDFDPLGFYLDGGKAVFGLPNMVNYELGGLDGSPCDTVYAIDTTTAISTPALDLDFTVTPTVSSGRYWLQRPSAEGQTVMVDVVDVNGRLVWQAEGILPMTIDLTGQAGGMYVLRVEQGLRSTRIKLLKQ